MHALTLEGTAPEAQAQRQATRPRTHAIVAEASGVYAGEGEADIRARAEVCCGTWHAQEPAVVANLLSALEQPLSSCEVHFPQSRVSLSRTTHLLERLHKEMRRQQRDIGMFHSAQGGAVLWY